MLVVIAGHNAYLSAHYAICVVLLSLVIRLLMGAVRAEQLKHTPYGERCKAFFDDLRNRDYCVAFMVGTIELAVYPPLIALGYSAGILGWLGVKTAVEWRWSSQRDSGKQNYTNFLLGNALVIVASFALTSLIEP